MRNGTKARPSLDVTVSATGSGDLLADRRYEYGRALASEEDHAAAADLFMQCLERVPDWAPGWFALGEAHAMLNNPSAARKAFRHAADLDPDGGLGAALALAALGEDVPPAADAAYVRGLFDQYASRFDRHLVDDLGYRAPALLRAALDGVCPPPQTFARVLDLGCGTGLMGEALQGRADVLIGVDLSPAMIAAARAKNLYNALHVGDVMAALATATEVDLITAADVLVYVGDLGPIMAAVAGALRPAGLFAFTVQSTERAQGVCVGADRRFAHGRAHLVERATAARLDIVVCEAIASRRDAGRDVPGTLCVLRR